ncbi:MAG: hypothetical protein U9Q71_05255 [Pseudomonadota bacterium]|nr:hypothetical protein [Pseudomonadota bacterium]
MPLRAHYIGEPLLARGLLLAGVKVQIPARRADQVWAALESVLDDADLVLIDAGLAQMVASRLEILLTRQPTPPVLRIGGLESAGAPAGETVEAARRELGICPSRTGLPDV